MCVECSTIVKFFYISLFYSILLNECEQHRSEITVRRFKRQQITVHSITLLTDYY